MNLIVENIKPIGNKILLEMLPNKESISQSGIVTNLASKAPTFKGKVLKVSEYRINKITGKKESITEVKVGDVVLIGDYADKPLQDTIGNDLVSKNGNKISIGLVDDILINFGALDE